LTAKIRGIFLSDKQQLIEIAKEAGVFSLEEVKVAGDLVDDYFKNTEGSGYRFYIADENGQVAGYICYGPVTATQGTWDVYWLAVSPKLGGQGIGRTLLLVMEEDIRGRSGRMIMIDTSSTPKYKAARSLYLKMGYDIVSTIPDFYSVGDDKEIFRKVI